MPEQLVQVHIVQAGREKEVVHGEHARRHCGRAGCRPANTTLAGMGGPWRVALFQAVEERLSHECERLDVLTVACARKHCRSEH